MGEWRNRGRKEEGRKKASKALLKEGWKEEGGKKRKGEEKIEGRMKKTITAVAFYLFSAEH